MKKFVRLDTDYRRKNYPTQDDAPVNKAALAIKN